MLSHPPNNKECVAGVKSTLFTLIRANVGRVWAPPVHAEALYNYIEGGRGHCGGAKAARGLP